MKCSLGLTVKTSASSTSGLSERLQLARRASIDAGIEVIKAFRSRDDEKFAAARRNAIDAGIEVIKANQAQSAHKAAGDAEPAPATTHALGGCHVRGRAPRLATNSRRRGSRRTSGTSSRGDPDSSEGDG